MNKVISYLGFAIKSNNVILGQGKLKHCEKDVHLILVCSSATPNLKALAHNVANKKHCPLIETKIPLENLTNKPGIKIIGVLEPNLSKAILLNKESISIG